MTTEHGFSLKSGFTKILCTPNIPLVTVSGIQQLIHQGLLSFITGLILRDPKLLVMSE